MLSALAGAFRSLGLDVQKASIDGSDGRVQDTFYVKQANDGGKVIEAESITNVKRTLEVRSGGCEAVEARCISASSRKPVKLILHLQRECAAPSIPSRSTR